MGVLCLVCKIGLEVLVVVLAILFIPIFLTSPLLFLPFVVWRHFVKFLAPYFIPNHVGLLTNLIMWVTIPYFLVREGIVGYDFNGFRSTSRKLTGRFQSSGLPMRVDDIKKIKQKWGVCFSSVVLAAIAGGFRNYMEKTGMRIPESFHVGMPFPWPHRHNFKLQNHMSFCVLAIPVGAADIERRVRIMESNWKRIKRSPVPLMNYTLMPLIGILPRCLVKLIACNDLTTVVLTNFPGPQEKINVFGRTTEDIEFAAGLFRGSCGVGFGMISCHGKLKLNLGIDTAIVPGQDQVDEIMLSIKREFERLANHSFSNFHAVTENTVGV